MKILPVTKMKNSISKRGPLLRYMNILLSCSLSLLAFLIIYFAIVLEIQYFRYAEVFALHTLRKFPKKLLFLSKQYENRSYDKRLFWSWLFIRNRYMPIIDRFPISTFRMENQCAESSCRDSSGINNILNFTLI